MGLVTTTLLPITSDGLGVCRVPGWSLKKGRRRESQRRRRRVEGWENKKKRKTTKNK
jgi:hypothetical protein